MRWSLFHYMFISTYSSTGALCRPGQSRRQIRVSSSRVADVVEKQQDFRTSAQWSLSCVGFCSEWMGRRKGSSCCE